MRRLEIERGQDGDREVVRVAGEIDMSTAEQLRDVLAPLANGSPVTIDLADVAFMDSTGLHAIWMFAQSANGSGPVRITNPSRVVLRAMEVVGMTEMSEIEVYPEGDRG